MTDQITRAFAISELRAMRLPHENVIHDEEIGERRWVRVHRAVFLADGGHHYAINWDEPKSEIQEDIQPFDWHADRDELVRATRVELRKRTVVIDEWLPVAAVPSGAEEASEA